MKLYFHVETREMHGELLYYLCNLLDRSAGWDEDPDPWQFIALKQEARRIFREEPDAQDRDAIRNHLKDWGTRLAQKGAH